MRCCIVVLGDIGRNPRMQYHALSLARNNVSVDYIGYGGTEPHKMLLDHPLVTFHYLHPVPKHLPGLGLVVKLFWQVITLFLALVFIPRPDLLLVQNPPGLPAIMMCFMMSRIRRFTFLIDWHNYTWTILSLRWEKDSFLVKMVKHYEFFFGRRADGGLCVTEAMQRDLRCFGVEVVTFYDRPFDTFRSLTADEQQQFLDYISQSYPAFKALSRTTGSDASTRQCLVVTSTSWSPDENFDMLLDALKLYDKACTAVHQGRFPRILVAVTGKGPLKRRYEQIFALLHLEYVDLVTLWLESADYPKLLACADLGVCLHYSSSGLDLPMKVVDMFGCGLPVLAITYKCIEELVEPKKNGFLFSSAEELKQQLQLVLDGFPLNNETLIATRTYLHTHPLSSWDDSWEKKVKPYLNRMKFHI